MYAHVLACEKQRVHSTKHQLERVESGLLHKHALLGRQPLPFALNSSQSSRITAHIALGKPAALSCSNSQACQAIPQRFLRDEFRGLAVTATHNSRCDRSNMSSAPWTQSCACRLCSGQQGLPYTALQGSGVQQSGSLPACTQLACLQAEHHCVIC